MLVSPPITYAIFAVTSGQSLDVAKVLTSVSLLQLITQPLSSLFQFVAPLMGAVACCGRVQSFLASADHHHQISSGSETRLRHQMSSETSIEMGALQSPYTRKVGGSAPGKAFDLHGVSLGWDPAKPVLRDISISFPEGKLSVIMGPVGSGKSTLLKALLGEVSVIQGAASSKDSRIAYCDQTPWLPNKSIQEIIIGFAEYDASRYASVLYATALEEDLQSMHLGNNTVVGSNGVTLSGGQKQRVVRYRNYLFAWTTY